MEWKRTVEAVKEADKRLWNKVGLKVNCSYCVKEGYTGKAVFFLCFPKTQEESRRIEYIPEENIYV